MPASARSKQIDDVPARSAQNHHVLLSSPACNIELAGLKNMMQESAVLLHAVLILENSYMFCGHACPFAAMLAFHFVFRGSLS